MIRFLKSASVRTLGESCKLSSDYTRYDYIEFLVGGELIQIRDVLVNDKIHAGLRVGVSADFAVAHYTVYMYSRVAAQITECFYLRTSEFERINVENLVEQINSRPHYLKLIPWVITMPIRTLTACLSAGARNPLGALIGSLPVTYVSFFLAPIIAPITFMKRRKSHQQLKESVHKLSEGLSASNKLLARQLKPLLEI